MKTAFIFAAGRGERLRPLTDLRPKPLCTIHGIPLIEYHVKRLALAGFEHLIINHAYLGGQIRHYLGTGNRFGVKISYSPEPPGALETGGGIVNALELIGDKPFLSVNADIYTDIDFATLALPIQSLAHLILINTPSYFSHSDFGLRAPNLLDNEHKQYTYSGIAYYDPVLFVNQPYGRYSIVPILRELAAQQKATAEVYNGQWFDIGTPARLRLVNDLR
jgi:MurNAc alpha-1-phosphate uridylyltransferase